VAATHILAQTELPLHTS